MNRIEWIDMTKGLVMILTVYMHSGLSNIPYVGEWVNAFFMPLFFFVSGILLKPEKYTISQFLKRRWKTLYRPYLIFSLVMIALSYTFVGGDLYTHIIKILYNGWGGYALWFIPVLAVAELAYFFICKKIENNGVVLLLLLICTALGYLSSKAQWYIPYNLLLVLTAIGFYGFGNKCKKLMFEINGKTLYFGILVAFAFSLTCILNPERPQWFVNELVSFWSYPAAIGGTLFICFCSKLSQSFMSKIIVLALGYIGRNTYVVLAFHQVTMQLLGTTGVLPNGLSIRLCMWIVMVILIELINRFVPQILGHTKNKIKCLQLDNLS